jgi:hypothetical protein
VGHLLELGLMAAGTFKVLAEVDDESFSSVFILNFPLTQSVPNGILTSKDSPT